MPRIAGKAPLILGVLVLFLAACAETGTGSTTTSVDTPTTTSESVAEAAITIQGFTFSGVRAVPVGTTVVATNQDEVTHTWTSADGTWNSGGLSNGDSFEFTFTEPGEYDYFCSIHPQMTGTITVEG